MEFWKYSEPRKLKTTIRQLKSKLHALENSVVFHPSFDQSIGAAQRASSTFNGFNTVGGRKAKKIQQKPSSWDQFVHVSIPTRRHVLALKEHWADVVERVWGKAAANPSGPPPCGRCKDDDSDHDHDLDSALAPRYPVSSLLQLSAYAMGRIAVELDEHELEGFYEWLPEHCRRWALWEHLVQLLMKDVAVDALLPGLADVCIDAGATLQAFEMYKCFFIVSEPERKEEYRWAWEKMHQLGMTDDWKMFLAEFYVSCQGVPFDLLDIDSAGVSIACLVLDHFADWDPQRTGYVLDYLIRHCCGKKHVGVKPDVCPCFALMSNAITYLSSSVQLETEVLFAMYVARSIGADSSVELVKSYASLTDSEQLYLAKAAEHVDSIDLDYCLSTFSSSQIYIVALKAQKANLGELACAALVYEINRLRQMHRDSGRGDHKLITEMEAALRDTQKVSQTKVNWRYEVIADCWITETPRLARIRPHGHDSFVHSTPSICRKSVPLTPNSHCADTPFKRPYPRLPATLRKHPAGEDDPLTASFSVERVRRAMNESSRQAAVAAAVAPATTPGPLQARRASVVPSSPISSSFPSQPRGRLSFQVSSSPPPTVRKEPSPETRGSNTKRKHNGALLSKKRRILDDITSEIDDFQDNATGATRPQARQKPSVFQSVVQESSDPLASFSKPPLFPPIQSSQPSATQLEHSDLDELVAGQTQAYDVPLKSILSSVLESEDDLLM
ncbi:hypothetical protein HDV03_003360 [Kappamyces sp. JEL0829]|nr:hypothetical protein HDV03_003360 [Kappamyces sp. JEL0829]